MVGFMEIMGASGCMNNRRISYKLFTGNHRNTIFINTHKQEALVAIYTISLPVKFLKPQNGALKATKVK